MNLIMLIILNTRKRDAYQIRYDLVNRINWVGISYWGPSWNLRLLLVWRTSETRWFYRRWSGLKSTPTVFFSLQQILGPCFQRISWREKICFRVFNWVFPTSNNGFEIECCCRLFFQEFWKILAFGPHIQHAKRFHSLWCGKNILECLWDLLRGKLRFKGMEFALER